MESVSRSIAHDWALCLHEAGHAVTAEVFCPGSVRGVIMDYEPGSPVEWTGEVFGDDTAAVCSWRWKEEDMAFWPVAVAAAQVAEQELGPMPGVHHGVRDDDMLFWNFDEDTVDRAREIAREVIQNHAREIGKVAQALARERTMTGEEIRTVIAA